jgi:hypothetical protein
MNAVSQSWIGTPVRRGLEMSPEDSPCTSPWEWGFDPGDRRPLPVQLLPDQIKLA